MRDTPTELQDFVRTGYTRAVRSVALLTHDMDSAQDAVDEAIARAWERLVRGRRIDCIPAWITTVAMNVARSRWYRKRRAPNPLDSHIADEPSDAESRIVVRDLIGKLSRRQQEVVVLHYLIDLDINTTADHLGISKGSVKTLLHRARREMARSCASSGLQSTKSGRPTS